MITVLFNSIYNTDRGTRVLIMHFPSLMWMLMIISLVLIRWIFTLRLAYTHSLYSHLLFNCDHWSQYLSHILSKQLIKIYTRSPPSHLHTPLLIENNWLIYRCQIDDSLSFRFNSAVETTRCSAAHLRIRDEVYTTWTQRAMKTNYTNYSNSSQT